MGAYHFLIRYSITCVQRARLSLDHLLIETKPMVGGVAFHPKARWETCSDLHVPQKLGSLDKPVNGGKRP